jgi:hypothetical protein
MSDYLKFTILGEDKFSGVFKDLNNSLSKSFEVMKSHPYLAVGAAAGAAATAIVGLGASLFAITKSTADAYDELRDLSIRLGISSEELSKLKYAASLSGVEIDTLSTALRSMESNVVAAAKGSGSAYDALTKLGISVKDIIHLSPDKQFQLIGEKINAVANASEKTSLAMDIFGGRATSVLQMFADDMEGAKKEAEALGLVMGAQDVNNADAFNDSLTRLHGVVTGLKNTIGTELMPILTGVFAEIGDFAVNNRAQVVEWGKAAVESLSTVAKVAVYTGAGIVDSWKGVVATWDIVKLGFLTVEGAIVGGVNVIEGASARLLKALGLGSTGLFKVLDAEAGKTLDILKDIGGQMSDVSQEINKNLFGESAISQASDFFQSLDKTISDLEKKGTAGKKDAPSIASSILGTPEKVESEVTLLGETLAKSLNDMLEQQQEARDALSELHAEYFNTEEEQLQAWYEKELELIGENDEAKAELEDIRQAREDEISSAKIAKEQDMYLALQNLSASYFGDERAKLDAWYADTLAKHKGNLDAQALDTKKYQEEKAKLDQADKDMALTRASDFFGNMASVAAVFGKQGASLAKAFAITQTVIDTYKAAQGAYAALAGIPIVGPALGIAAAAAATASGLARVASIRSQKIEGIAHGGMTSVPKESTYFLDQGERILSPNQNKDLTDALKNGMGGGTVNQTNTFHILENSTNSDALLSMSASKWQDVVQEKIVPALRRLNLAGVGI